MASPPPTDPPPGDALQHLARDLTAAGLDAPALLLLDVLQPLDVVSSQVALFCQPFMRGMAWHRYCAALSDPTAWATLRAQVVAARSPAARSPAAPPDSNAE